MAGAWLSIGALSKATGIAVETLRTWARYGFPVPERKPSGHRVYPVSVVPRLRRISQALALGHRAGQVVTASEAALGHLLAAAAVPGIPQPAPAGLPTLDDSKALLRLVKEFDAARLTSLWLGDWARMGPVDFLESRKRPAPIRVLHESRHLTSYYDIPGGKPWAASFSQACRRTYGDTAGAHGLRHTYTQKRIDTLLGNNVPEQHARKSVSVEIGHFRVEVIDVYLRGTCGRPGRS